MLFHGFVYVVVLCERTLLFVVLGEVWVYVRRVARLGLLGAPLDFVKEFLRVRTDLRTRSSAYDFLYFFPILAVVHQSQHESFVLFS